MPDIPYQDHMPVQVHSKPTPPTDSFMIFFVHGSSCIQCGWKTSLRPHLRGGCFRKKFCLCFTLSRVKSPKLIFTGLSCCFRSEANFTRHPATMGALETMHLVRYQEHPANWGPGKKASSSSKTELKRKRSTEVLEVPPAKH